MQTVKRIVRQIPALYFGGNKPEVKKLRLGYYARVSTLNEEQEDSYKNQKEYFSRFINSRPDWELVGEYSDWGITGTKTDCRKDFNRMIEDCRAGKIDKILVKSVSRFARNTVDTLKYVRELKELGVSVWFDNESIDTLTTGGDILITILAAMAEQESRTISTNITWAYGKRFKEGKVIINYRHILGWNKEEFINEEGDKDSRYVIVESEAEIVRRIFKEYASGRTLKQISDDLNSEGIFTKKGNEWRPTSIDNVLTNEKYTGNAILGKTYKVDVLSPRRKNDGSNEEHPLLYAENSHPAIVSQTLFDIVAAERRRRREMRCSVNTGAGKYSSRYGLSGLLICGDCGGKFRRFGRSLASGEYVPTWICVNHQKDRKRCEMKPLKEIDIYDGYRRAVNELLGDAKELMTTIKNNIEEEFKASPKTEMEETTEKIHNKQEQIIRLFRQKRNGEIDDEYYTNEYARLSKEIIELQAEEQKLKDLTTKAAIEEQRLSDILAILNEGEIQYMDNDIMRKLIDVIRVIDKHTIEFQFKCGVNIAEKI